ncbi:MAG: hypothetical protein ACQEQF_09810 [Bacillota bacterium]
MTETERKRYAKEVIKKMWGSSVSYSDEDLTPELCNWVIGIYLSSASASKQIDGLENFLGVGPWTSIKGIGWKVIKALRNLFKSENSEYKDWNPIMKNYCQRYRYEFQTAVNSGMIMHLSEPRIKYTGKSFR